MTAAYTVASEDILVFEAQNMGAISVITPIADHILLAVTGPEPKLVNGGSLDEADPAHGEGVHQAQAQEHEEEEHDDDDDDDDDKQQRIRTDLEVISQELAHVLRGELATLKWPDDI